MKRIVFGLLFFAAPGAWAQAERVTDINTAHTGPAARFAGFDVDEHINEIQPFGHRVAFTANDGIHGVELWLTDGTTVGTRRLTDLCPGFCSSNPRALTVLEDRLFFSADDGVHGAEPFVSDGTPEGTLALGDLWPGQGSSRILSAIATSTQIFFSAATPDYGRELWRTDGTAEGTRRVTDLAPGPESPHLRFIGAVGGILLFSIWPSGEPTTLWLSNGTTDGTTMVPVPIGTIWWQVNDEPVSTGNLVFFIEKSGSFSHVVRSDGTAAGTFRVTPGEGGNFDSLAQWNGTVFFLAYEFDSVALWRTDGTLGGTQRVATLPAGVQVRNLLPGTNGLYFQGSDDAHGAELWFSDGTAAGTRFVKDIRPGSEWGITGLFPLLAPAGPGLLFFADDGASGVEPWISNGSAEGTQRVADLTPGPDSSFGLFDEYRGWKRGSVGGRAFFWATTPGSGFELWTSDGTAAGTTRPLDLNAMTSSLIRADVASGYPSRPPVEAPSGLLLLASEQGVDYNFPTLHLPGLAIWRVDHNPLATSFVHEFEPDYQRPDFPGLVPTSLGAAFLDSAAFWQTDGTEVGTAPVPAAAGLSFSRLARTTTHVLLVEQTGLPETGHLRAAPLDLSSVGPRLLSGPSTLFVYPAGEIAFTTSDSGLAVSDGSPAGTRVISTALPRGFAEHFTPLPSGRTVFLGSSGDQGIEPWRFELDQKEPEILLDIRPGPDHGLFPGLARRSSYQFPTFAPIGTQALFGADDGIHGFELWATDGTAPGTRLVRDLHPGATHSDLERITAVGDRAYFVADDGVHGREIWHSDGTAAGTRLLRDLAPGPGSAVPQELTAIGDFLVFNAWAPDHGRELWISDGTEIGTRRLTDVAPGPLSSSPVTYVAAGGWLYFTANDNLTGDELWRLPLARLQPGVIFADGFESGNLSAWSTP